MLRRNSCSSSAITSYSARPGARDAHRALCARPPRCAADARISCQLGARLEQAHVVQQVVERDEFLRLLRHCATATARSPLTQPITRWSNSGCAPIA